MRPEQHITACTEGHRRVEDAVANLTEFDVRVPSLLPGWSRAHVVAHLTLKTRSHAAVFAGAARDEMVAQFPDGLEAEQRDVGLMAASPLDELARWLMNAFHELEASWHELPTAGWHRVAVSSAGDRTLTEFVHRHLRDVEVHHVDLDIGYRPDDWPSTFVETELPKRLKGLSDRAPAPSLLAWLLGRASAPELAPW